MRGLSNFLMFLTISAVREQVLVDCSGTEGEEKTPEKAFLSKKAALLQLVDQRPVLKTIIFCNKVSPRYGTLDSYSKNCVKVSVLFWLLWAYISYSCPVHILQRTELVHVIIMPGIYSCILLFAYRLRHAGMSRMHLAAMTAAELSSRCFRTMQLFHKRRGLKVCSSFWNHNRARVCFSSALTGTLSIPLFTRSCLVIEVHVT